MRSATSSFHSHHPVLFIVSSSFSSPSIVLSDYDYDRDLDLDLVADANPPIAPHGSRKGHPGVAVNPSADRNLRHPDQQPLAASPSHSLDAATLVTSPPFWNTLAASPSATKYNHPSAPFAYPSTARSLPLRLQAPAPLTELNVARLRSWTRPAPLQRAAGLRNADMTSLEHPPGSPPDLTSSKSSKSSSFRSSSAFSSPDAVFADLSHFEDIGLDDEHHPPASGPAAFVPAGFKDSPRQSAASIVPGKAYSPALPPTRELVNGTPKPAFSSPVPSKPLPRKSSKQALHLPLANGRPLHHSPALAHNALRNRGASRSPSPNRLPSGPASPRPLPGASPALRLGISPIMRVPAGRRGSTQARRSAKDIEAEYHDSDEELPEDASLWNVPLSPSLYRAASAASSATPSADNSPERPHYLNMPDGAKSAAALPSSRTVPMPSKSFSPVIESGPASPVSPRLPRAASAGAAEGFAFGKARAKSWSNVLSDLSEEARSLSQALDAHDATAPPAAAEAGWPRGPRRANSAFVELPPLRRGNVMIDPLPVSKEKEKVLSRTRPSWLPPKSQKEERKHLREYQKMMEHSLEAGTPPLSHSITFNFG